MAIARKELAFVKKAGKVQTVELWTKMHYNVYPIVLDMANSIWIHKHVIVKPNGVVMIVQKVYKFNYLVISIV